MKEARLIQEEMRYVKRGERLIEKNLFRRETALEICIDLLGQKSEKDGEAQEIRRLTKVVEGARRIGALSK